MDKLLTFPGKTEKGIFTYVLGRDQNHLIKTAQEYHPEIAAYINNAVPIPGKTQFLLTALGAYEYWGQNANADSFKESELAYSGPEYGHKTFETHARIYKHHANKDPNRSYGRVALAVYNYTYHRVELIVVFDDEKIPDVVEQINNGNYPDFSMGCRVKFDVCNICGNRAPTRKFYCEHAKFYLGRIDPISGKLACVFNPRPVFFDISVVLVGADRIAKGLKKIAHAKTESGLYVSSALLAEKMAEIKAAEMDKEIPASPPASQDPVEKLKSTMPAIMAREKPLPRDVLSALSRHGLPTAVSTMVMMGILPKPQEFQRLVLSSLGKEDWADRLDDADVCFDPEMEVEESPLYEKVLGLSARRFSPEAMKLLTPYVAERSYTQPHFERRIVLLVKEASQQYVPNYVKHVDPKRFNVMDDKGTFGLMGIMAIAAGLYTVLANKAPTELVDKMDWLIRSHPGLVVALAGATHMMFNHVAGEGVKGQFGSSGVEGSPDTNNVGQIVFDNMRHPTIKLGTNLSAAARRIVVVPTIVAMGSGLAQKRYEANPGMPEGTTGYVLREYPKLLQGLSVADGLLAIGGKGSYGVTKKLVDSMKKQAEAEDYVTDGVVWPLVGGPAGLPGRMVIGLSGRAAVDGFRKFLSKASSKNKIKKPEGKS